MSRSNYVPVWLRWMRGLPLPIRSFMARRWRRIAHKRADQAHKFAYWAGFIEPEAADDD